MAAKYAIMMAKAYHCKLIVVSVVDTATIKQLLLSKIFVLQEGQEYERNLETDGKRYLSFTEELARSKGVKVECLLRKGVVATEILTVADEKKADAILLGGWERDWSARDVMRPVHQEIMANARCSVLLVKQPDIDQLFKLA